jgi:hypothetical protein
MNLNIRKSLPPLVGLKANNKYHTPLGIPRSLTHKGLRVERSDGEWPWALLVAEQKDEGVLLSSTDHGHLSIAHVCFVYSREMRACLLVTYDVFWTWENISSTPDQMHKRCTKGASFLLCHNLLLLDLLSAWQRSNHRAMQSNAMQRAFPKSLTMCVCVCVWWMIFLQAVKSSIWRIQHAFWLYSISNKLQVTLTTFFLLYPCCPNATQNIPECHPKHPQMPPKTSHYWMLGLLTIQLFCHHDDKSRGCTRKIIFHFTIVFS